MIVAQFIGVVLLGYLIGAIPVGLIVGRLRRGIDVRQHGSGSMGMTNVMRTVGTMAGAGVFIADLLKGAAAVALVWPIFGAASADMVAWGHAAAGTAAVIGHCWPLYAGFKGGRGISTGFGALLVIRWPVGLIAFAIFLIVVAIFRYVSLGSILAALTMAGAMIPFVLNDSYLAYIIFSLLVAGVVVFRHRDNIKRLIRGTESKIGQKAGAT